MKIPQITYTDRGLPYLDQPTLDFIFEGVYGLDVTTVTDERFRGFLEILYQMQSYNYQYRQDAVWRVGDIVTEAVGPMEQSEGTLLWFALALAIKEWYGLSRSTLAQLLRQVLTTR